MGNELSVEITGPESSALQRRMEHLVKRDDDGSLTILKHEGWVAVPEERTAHLGRLDIERLTPFFTRAKIQHLLAIALELQTEIPAVRRIAASEDGLYRFNKELGPFNCALCTPDFSLMVVCSTDDFLIYMGKEELVEGALGRPLSVAYGEFYEMPARILDAKLEKLFLAILRRLKDDYAAALPGASVEVPGEWR